MKIYSNEALKVKLARRNKLRAALNIVYYAVMILIIICSADILYQKFVKKADEVSVLGFKPYIVLSGSMEPALNSGDLAIVRQVKEKALETGDIVTFVDDGGAVVTHRITGVIIRDGKKYYSTKGDSNNAEDIGLISMENIKGKYFFKISGGGLLVKEIMTPSGMMLLALAVVAVYTVMGRKNDRRVARHLIRKRYKKQSIGQGQE